MPITTLAPTAFAHVDVEVQNEARSVVQEIGDSRRCPLTLHAEVGDIEVPHELSYFLFDIINQIACGTSVAVVGLPEELTTTTAAERLGVSRPTLMKMIHNGEIPAYKVKSHTRLKTADVFSFIEGRQTGRLAAAAALREMSEKYPELGAD